MRRGAFVGIVASAVVGYALKLLVVLCFPGNSMWMSIPIFTVSYTVFLPLAVYVITRGEGHQARDSPHR